MPRSNVDREILRKALLRYLVFFHPAAFEPDVLRRCIRERGYIDFLPDLPEVQSALEVLAGLSLAEQVSTRIALGASLYYRATAQGVIEQERADS